VRDGCGRAGQYAEVSMDEAAPRDALLGALRVALNGEELQTPALGRRERAVLVLLALNAGRVVSTGRLIDELWPEAAPDGASNTVQVYVSRVRKALGPRWVRRDSGGYALDVSPGEVDVGSFEELARRCREALRAGEFEHAADLAGRALRHWEGPPLADGVGMPSVAAAAARLDELRLAVMEDEAEADVALGRGPRRLADLQSVVAEHPFRERSHAALMSALTQAGRHADALAHYAAYRSRCVDELGLEPGEPLRALQAAILDGGRGIPAAETSPEPAETPSRRLPTGTVSLLFSDIEGSTALLARLGDDYARALSDQRRILREAWAGHDGVEMGTEGDSFFVVFRTAPDAIAAAVEGQQGLAAVGRAHGAQVRVRIGIHTGSPRLYEDGYVGMDVHRAARIAAAAHGGQIVVSAATADLAALTLPEGVGLSELGVYHLKDIPAPERLLQVDVDGLPTDFPPLKTLGAASSLPRPSTPLIGRDEELRELAALMSSSGVRLVTLTGPGGSGKTRLAIAVAERLSAQFPDGVYFVDLAAATSRDVMWTTIAETLDLSPEGRVPPAFFRHVAHRTSLFVLDNLEQIADASDVVEELLAEAPQLVVMATSRRPLHLAAEHEHPTPPLTVPIDSGAAGGSKGGAVELFESIARRVRPSFAVTPDNVSEVIEICRRLDGLPLAVEVTAARIKLLSPKALLARLDSVLDLTDSRAGQPARQRTLRAAVGWSYHLLPPAQQKALRTLAVFRGGADLDAVAAVCSDNGEGGDPLDVVADLLDASLVTVGQSADGEPRIAMLETVRVFALDELRRLGEEEPARAAHARHYLELAEQLAPSVFAMQENLMESNARMRLEHDNVREVLAWSLSADPAVGSDADRVSLGRRLAAAVAGMWTGEGYLTEGARWLSAAVADGDADSPELAGCLFGYGAVSMFAGELATAVEMLSRSASRWRRIGNLAQLALSLTVLAEARRTGGDTRSARSLLTEAIEAAEGAGHGYFLASALTTMADVEDQEGNIDAAISTYDRAIAELDKVHSPFARVRTVHNKACALRAAGRAEEAERLMRLQMPAVVAAGWLVYIVHTAEDYAAALADLGDGRTVARLLGAADAVRTRNAMPRSARQSADIEVPIATAKTAIDEQRWKAAYEEGSQTPIEEVLMDAAASRG
jgi:predicted ATPase/DNA-binding SARP family transcriptional activator